MTADDTILILVVIVSTSMVTLALINRVQRRVDRMIERLDRLNTRLDRERS